MKKILVSTLALALPALASAQTQLLSGYNFGQFIGSGVPALDGSTGDFVGSVGANFSRNVQAPLESGGGFVGNNGLTGNYQAPAPGGRVYWDGTGGSTIYPFDGTSIVAATVGNNTVNGATVQSYNMGLPGDDLGLALRVGQGSIAFLQNTTGYTDYAPAGALDANLTFAAQVTAPVTVNWLLNGVGIGSTVLTGTAMTSYTFDLPANFYGAAQSTLVAQFSGTATIDNMQINGFLAPIPEPSTYAAILGVATFGVVMLRRRKQVLGLG